MKILNVEPEGYSPIAQQVLEGLGDVTSSEMSREELLEQVRDADVLITRLLHSIDAEVIDAGRRLRAIVTATTGLDHIDTAYAASRGVRVLSLRGETEFLRSITSTAEHSWALLLALVRRIPAAAMSVKGGDWDRDSFRGRTLAGKRLGVVGVGRVGTQVADFGSAFGMDVSGYDAGPTSSWPTGVERLATLEDLLPRTDVLTIHVSLEGGSGIIGARELEMLPAGAVVINTSRGEVLDEAALVDALTSGRLAGAALDVLTGERDPATRASSPALAYAREHEELLITPHIAGATVDAMRATEVFMANKLVATLVEASGD